MDKQKDLKKEIKKIDNTFGFWMSPKGFEYEKDEDLCTKINEIIERVNDFSFSEKREYDDTFVCKKCNTEITKMGKCFTDLYCEQCKEFVDYEKISKKKLIYFSQQELELVQGAIEEYAMCAGGLRKKTDLDQIILNKIRNILNVE